MQSPTLQNLEPNRRPAPGVACTTCPNSVWYTTKDEAKCYCRVMFLLSYDSTEPSAAVTACDGQTIGQD